VNTGCGCLQEVQDNGNFTNSINITIPLYTPFVQRAINNAHEDCQVCHVRQAVSMFQLGNCYTLKTFHMNIIPLEANPNSYLLNFVQRGSTIDHWRSRCKGHIIMAHPLSIHSFIRSFRTTGNCHQIGHTTLVTLPKYGNFWNFWDGMPCSPVKFTYDSVAPIASIFRDQRSRDKLCWATYCACQFLV
jgi:hypothetical protein